MTTKTEKRRQKREKALAAPKLDVDQFMAQHGQYERDGLRGTINRGGTPIARWTAAGAFDDKQLAAISYCIRLWDRASRHTGLVQDLLKVVGQSPSSGWSQQEALDELVKLKDGVPRYAWDVFENVCRFDEPAGVAGSKLTTDKGAQTAVARQCVKFVADIISLKKGY